jgi:hypothetical protein
MKASRMRGIETTRTLSAPLPNKAKRFSSMLKLAPPTNLQPVFDQGGATADTPVSVSNNVIPSTDFTHCQNDFELHSRPNQPARRWNNNYYSTATKPIPSIRICSRVDHTVARRTVLRAATSPGACKIMNGDTPTMRRPQDFRQNRV